MIGFRFLGASECAVLKDALNLYAYHNNSKSVKTFCKKANKIICNLHSTSAEYKVFDTSDITIIAKALQHHKSFLMYRINGVEQDTSPKHSAAGMQTDLFVVDTLLNAIEDNYPGIQIVA